MLKTLLKWAKRLIILLLLGGVVWLLHAVLLRWTGSFLVASDPPRKAQAILALSGESPARILGAFDLYRNGYSPLILLTRGPHYRAEDELSKRGIVYTNIVEIDRQTLIRLGVPADSVVVLEEDVTSTEEEALAVQSHFKGKPLRNILLVTSRYHSRRARMIFNHVFKGMVEIISVPTPYDEFETDNWWANRENLKHVLSEYQKLVFYSLQYFWEWLPSIRPSEKPAASAASVGSMLPPRQIAPGPNVFSG